VHLPLLYDNDCLEITLPRGVTGGWAGWAIAHPFFFRIEGAAGQRRRAALLLAHPAFGSHLRPCFPTKF